MVKSLAKHVLDKMANLPPAHFPNVSAPLSWLAVKSEKSQDRLIELEAQHEQWLKSISTLYSEVTPIGKSEEPTEQVDLNFMYSPWFMSNSFGKCFQEEEEEEEPEEEEEYDESGDGDDIMDELDTDEFYQDQDVEVVAEADRPRSTELPSSWLWGRTIFVLLYSCVH